MGITGITGYTSQSSSRVTGLASNMDTDSMVKQAMKAETAKYTKILQKRQIDEWKIDSYREVTSSLQSFYKEYFDPLATKKLKSTDSFASFAATYGANAAGTITATDYIGVTPGADAKAGTYSITKLKAATAASISGGNVTKPVECLEISDASVAKINASNDNNAFVFTLNGITKEIALDGSGLTTVQQLQAQLQTKLNEAFGTDTLGNGKITVGFTSNVTNDGGKLSFSPVRPTDTFSIGTAYNDGASTLFSVKPAFTSPFVLNETNNKFDLTVGGVTKTVIVSAGAVPKVYTNATDLAADIQTAAQAQFVALAANTFTAADGKVTYSGVTIERAKDGTQAALGIDTSNLSNKIDLNAKISDIKSSLSTALNVAGSAGDIQFAINGKFFTFDSTTNSINDIIKKVNADSTINATMKYDITTNSFKVESRNTGAASKVVVEDKTGNLMQSLGIANAAGKYGTDASVTINNTEIVRPTNSFSYDGLTYNIKNDFDNAADPIKITVSSDATKTYDFIKGFVDKYNEIIDKLNDKISEKRYKDYQPLTDEQEAAMTEDQIKKWDEKAKSGLLKNDSIVSDILSKMRSALYASVEGTGISLSSIGITTSSNYEDKGKLEINEGKLKDALANKPEEIATLFTANSDVTYFDAINSSASSSLRTQRYNESGIAQRFSDLIQDAIRTNTDFSGLKGTLLEKAGIVGDRSEYKSVLAKEMLQYDDDAYEMNKKLISKEKALYQKYAAMESALNKLNSQQNQMTQMLGGL